MGQTAILVIGYGISLGVTKEARTALLEGADNAYQKKEYGGHKRMKGVEFVFLAVGAVGFICRISFVRLTPNKDNGTRYRQYLSGRMNHFI